MWGEFFRPRFFTLLRTTPSFGYRGQFLFRDLFYKEASLQGSNSYGVWDCRDEFDIALKLIEKSNVAGILKLNCNATDFYSEKAYPTYLYYNPYNEKKTVRYNASKNNVDLYDIITKSIIATNINKDTEFDINPDDVRLLVEIPTGVTLHHQNNKIIAEGRVVCY